MKYLCILFVLSIQALVAQDFLIKHNRHSFKIQEILSKYIQQESISGNEKRAGEWLKSICLENGLFITQMGSENGNYNFAASIRPLSSGLPNVIFLNHIDVVPVGDTTKWQHHPFSGEIDNGEVWGRGAFDNKGAAIIQLAAVIQAAKTFKKAKGLKYNVTFLAVSCEETQCDGGAKYVAKNYLSELNPAVFIGEGPPGLNGVVEANPNLPLFGISIAHKRAFWLKLELEVPTSGHGSTTPLSYSNKDMVIALNNIISHSQPAELTGVNKELLKDLGSLEHGIKASALKHPSIFRSLIMHKLRERPELFSLLSNTITLTSLESETNIMNVIPKKTTALLDCRLLPNTNRDEFLEAFKKQLDNDSIQISVVFEMPPMVPSSDTSMYYKALNKAIQTVYPKAVTIPMILPNFNDVGVFRSNNITCYSVFPIHLDLEHIMHVHNYNESLPIAPMIKGKQTYDEFLRLLMKN
jgi:acetylornithine deacetylase/succinyl-diaminopimelate desuccinylase-like protein